MNRLISIVVGLLACFGVSAADINITNVTRAAAIPPGSYVLGTTGLTTRLLPIGLIQVWTNDGVFIEPSSGGQSSRFLRFTSAASDDPTNVLARFNTGIPWSADDEEILTAWANGGTNVIYISQSGGVEIGRSVIPWWAPDSSDVLVGVHDMGVGENNQSQLVVAAIDSSAPSNKKQSKFRVTLAVSDDSPSGLLNYTAIPLTQPSYGFSLEASAAVQRLILDSPIGQTTILEPTSSDGSPGYVFDTTTTHTSGNLLELKNNGTNKLAIAYNGLINGPGFAAGLTYSLTVITNGANTATLHFTNGVLMSITAP